MTVETLAIAQRVTVVQRCPKRTSSSAMTTLVTALALTWPPVTHHVLQVLFVQRRDLTVETLVIAQRVTVVQRCQKRTSSSAMTALVGALALTWLPVTHHAVQVLFVQRRDMTVETSVIAQRVTAVQRWQKQMSSNGLTLPVGVQVKIWPPGMHRVNKILYVRSKVTTIVILAIASASIAAQLRRGSATTRLAGVQAQTWPLEMHRAMEISLAQGRAETVDNMATAQGVTVAL